MTNLDDFLGKNINIICDNKFHDAGENHCAHFVSHVKGFSFSFNCRQYKGGKNPGGNVRVNEIFAQCPRVGVWADADKTAEQLVFVTRKNAVNVATKTMQSIPEKHIGIYRDGSVYHYSNTNDKVVKQPVDEFFARFQQIYAGDQGLFFGEFPLSDLMLTVDATAASITQPYSFKLRQQGTKWLAKRADVANAPEFHAGTEVIQPAKGFYGLYFPGSDYYGPLYDPAKYIDTIGHWAYLLDVTAACESKNRFNLINTYDRARFTFGFYQLAAHTPRDNLILLFRSALQDPTFQALFPDLKLIGGKVFREASDGTQTDLEEEIYDPASKEDQLQKFMAYLNPERTKVDMQEVLQVARVVWWANNSPEGLQLQVQTASSILQQKMSKRYAQWYALDGQPDIICAIVADIHHQGRAKKPAVKAALASSKPEKELMKLGLPGQEVRIKTLGDRITKWRDAGKMGTKVYRAAANQFE